MILLSHLLLDIPSSCILEHNNKLAFPILRNNLTNSRQNREYAKVKANVACEQALHLGDIVKSTRARGKREETRLRGAGSLLAGERERGLSDLALKRN